MAASGFRATASFKKVEGIITIRQEEASVTWRPSTGPSPSVIIPIDDITNLQKSPVTSAKASVKLVVQPAGKSAAENYVFTFTSATTAKDEQTQLVDILKELIATSKAQPTQAQIASNGKLAPLSSSRGAGQSTTSQSDEDLYADMQLIGDSNLQRSLLGANPELRRRHDEAFSNKPESITLTQFSTQFWSTRLHLLRAHAVSKNQQQGVYNVLPDLKFRRENDKVELKITKEQIQLIFNQHPLVKRVYDDLVPKKFQEMEFWSKFINSQLIKKLKGEKITEVDSSVPEIDRYMSQDENAELTRQFIVSHVPRFLDVEGNEQNHSQRKGNAPDVSMRPQSHQKVPVLRALNALSEKMLANVAGVDSEAHTPAGMDENTFSQLRLRDLQRQSDDNRVKLNIKDHHQFFNADNASQIVSDRVDGRSLLQNLGNECRRETLLTSVLEGGEDTAKSAIDAIMKSASLRSEGTAETLGDQGLSSLVLQSADMTHNTSIEFLHYFWSVFTSGEESRAGELAKLRDTLSGSLERIRSVAAQAENEKQQLHDQRRRQVEEHYARTGKRRAIGKINGGQEAVNSLLKSTVRAIDFAGAEYDRIRQDQSAATLAD